MNGSYTFAAVGVAAVLFLAGPARAESARLQSAAAAAQVDDDALESNVENTLKKDSVLAPRDIDVEAKRGVVTLTGSVRTSVEKDRAGRLAKITGVTSVINNIEVKPDIDRSKTDAAVDKTKEGLNKAVDATAKGAQKTKEGVEKGVGASEKGVGKAAEKTAGAIDKAGDKASDASVSTSVKSGLSKDPLVKDAAISVHTSDHVVTLKGTVASAAAKTRAEDIAVSTSGVSRVVNDLVIQNR
jgi:hyperosmotically inducible periplasmic protein